MVSLVNGLNDTDCVTSRKSAKTMTEAETAHAILAVMCAFLVGGIALSLNALSVAALWP